MKNRDSRDLICNERILKETNSCVSLIYFPSEAYIIIIMQINDKAKSFGESLKPCYLWISEPRLNCPLLHHDCAEATPASGGLTLSETERNKYELSIYQAPGFCQTHNLHVLLLCNSAFTPIHASQSLCWAPSLSRPVHSF